MKTFTTIKNKNWFTLIETLVWILIVSVVVIAGFSALSALMVGKVKLIEKTAIQKEAFYFSEKLFEMIKTGGTIDYEEYWNRHSYTPIDDPASYGSGHFLLPTGFGNYGRNGVLWISWWIDSYAVGWFPYYCVSADTPMWYNGCLTTNNTVINPLNASWQDIDYTSPRSLQRYGQYELQFIDYNSDADFDSATDPTLSRWDEDNSSLLAPPNTFHFIWDDDDLYLWQWPEAFPAWINVWELYLINGNWDERIYFRFNAILDPNAPAGETCTGTLVMSGDGCLWTIEFLKLKGEDVGYAKGQGIFDVADFKSTGWSFYKNDGKVDTWMIDADFNTLTFPNVMMAWYDGENYWQPIFPDTINVKNVQFFPYPNKDLNNSWRDVDPSVNIAPYVRISMTLSPSWKSRKKIRWEIPDIEINTTVQLTDIFN